MLERKGKRVDCIKTFIANRQIDIRRNVRRPAVGGWQVVGVDGRLARPHSSRAPLPATVLVPPSAAQMVERLWLSARTYSRR